MDDLINTGIANALSWAVTGPAGQGEAVEYSGDSTIVFPRHTELHK